MLNKIFLVGLPSEKLADIKSICEFASCAISGKDTQVSYMEIAEKEAKVKMRLNCGRSTTFMCVVEEKLAKTLEPQMKTFFEASYMYVFSDIETLKKDITERTGVVLQGYGDSQETVEDQVVEEEVQEEKVQESEDTQQEESDLVSSEDDITSEDIFENEEELETTDLGGNSEVVEDTHEPLEEESEVLNTDEESVELETESSKCNVEETDAETNSETSQSDSESDDGSISNDADDTISDEVSDEDTCLTIPEMDFSSDELNSSYRMRAEINTLNHLNKQLQEQLEEEIKEQNEEIQQELCDTKEKLNTANQNLEDLKKLHSKVVSELDTKKELLGKKDAELKNKDLAIKTRNDKISRLSGDNKSLLNKVETFKTQYAKLADDIKAIQEKPMVNVINKTNIKSAIKQKIVEINPSKNIHIVFSGSCESVSDTAVFIKNLINKHEKYLVVDIAYDTFTDFALSVKGTETVEDLVNWLDDKVDEVSQCCMPTEFENVSYSKLAKGYINELAFTESKFIKKFIEKLSELDCKVIVNAGLLQGTIKCILYNTVSTVCNVSIVTKMTTINLRSLNGTLCCLDYDKNTVCVCLGFSKEKKPKMYDIIAKKYTTSIVEPFKPL